MKNKNEDEKFNEALRIISEIAKELNKLPKLKYVELLGEINDLNWCLDGIAEAKERMKTETDAKSVCYHIAQIAKRRLKIKSKWLYILN